MFSCPIFFNPKSLIKAAAIIAILLFLSPAFIPRSCVMAETTAFVLPAIENSALLSESWNAYKKKFIQSDGRVIDWFEKQISTSEGQSYALLRAVWIGDRNVFDTVLAWILNNLQKTDTRLFAWKWGKKADGSWGILENESATDGDEDIALALIFAYNKWGSVRYRELAANIVKDIWTYETIELKGARYVTAGDWVKSGNDIIHINPSYLAPYAYRMFASIDASHNWLELVDTSYNIINRCSEPSKAYLPPDWCMLNRNGRIILPNNSDKKGDTSYDAFRTYWRLAFDYAWFGEERAMNYIKKGDFLINYWNIKQRLTDAYTRDGISRSDNEALSVYGILLPFFTMIEPASAEVIYNRKISPSYKNGFWGNPDEYYTQNWAWLGIALYSEIRGGEKKPHSK